MAIPAYLGQVGTFFNPVAATSTSMTTTLAVEVGATILVAVRSGGGFPGTGVTDSAGNTYSVIATSALVLNITTLFATVVTSPLASGQTITVTVSSSTANVQANAIAFSNLQMPQIASVSATAQGTGTTSITVGPVTPIQTSGIILCVGSYNYSASVPPNTTASGYTKLSLTGTQWMGIAWKPIGSISAESVTWTHPLGGANTANWGATISALNATTGEFFATF